jgi:hypothetical protein
MSWSRAFETLDLPAGYHVERGEAGVYLMDPEGQRVMRLPGDVASTDPRESGHQHPSAEPGPGRWQELCHALLMQLSQERAECERLRVRVTELEERLEVAERDQVNAIGEDVHEVFRKRVRQVADRRQRSRRRGVR